MTSVSINEIVPGIPFPTFRAVMISDLVCMEQGKRCSILLLIYILDYISIDLSMFSYRDRR